MFRAGVRTAKSGMIKKRQSANAYTEYLCFVVKSCGANAVFSHRSIMDSLLPNRNVPLQGLFALISFLTPSCEIFQEILLHQKSHLSWQNDQNDVWGVAVATHPHVSCTFGSIILKHGHLCQGPKPLPPPYPAAVASWFFRCLQDTRKASARFSGLPLSALPARPSHLSRDHYADTGF